MQEDILFTVANIALGGLFVLGVSLIREPLRRQSMVVLLVFAVGCYWQGGLGMLEYPFIILGLISAVAGMRWYPMIGVGWLVHTIVDMLHHQAGLPLLPSVPLSSLGCAVFDIVIAIWFFVGAPNVWDTFKRRRTRGI